MIGRTCPLRVQDVFPWLQQEVDREINQQGGDLEESEEFPENRDIMIDMTSSLPISGLLHILHNSSKNLGVSMEIYSETVDRLSHVANLLRRPPTRDRLLETCCSQGRAQFFKADLQRFRGKVHKERWGTVASAVLEILAVEQALRYVWDIDKYGRSRGSLQFDGGDEAWRSEVETVNAAICSDFWWDSLRVLSHMAKLIMRLFSWAEGCSCHSHLNRDRATLEQRQMWDKCPFRGMRAPDLAVGGLFEVFEEFSGVLLVELSGTLSSQLSQQERVALLRDFEHGRADISLALALRLAHWQQHPHLLYGCVVCRVCGIHSTL